MPLDIELLESSFAHIKPRLPAFSRSFYANLFIFYPETKPLFANTDMEAQSQKLVESLIWVVINLRKPGILTQTLRNLGARHIKYGVLPEYYPLVGNTLLTTFKQYLRSDWTPQVRQAWVDAYDLIMKIMLDGAEHSQKEVALDAPVKIKEDTATATPNSASAELPLDIELLESSFAQIRPRLLEFSLNFYTNLFIMYPETQPLFANTDMEAQSQKLVESLVLVVVNLRKPGILTQALKNLGARHVGYGTLPEYYPLVGNALLTTFKQYLRSDWTPQVKQAWVDAYDLITEIMLEGAEDSQEEVGFNAPVKIKEDIATATPNSASAELPLDIELLESSFAQIRPKLSDFSLNFYANLFILYPETKPLFANTDMEAQSQKLVESLVLVVVNLRKPSILTQALRNLGARHIDYGVLPEHYPLVGNALLATFEQYLRSDWTPQVKQAWVDAYNLITEIMLEGANYAPSDIMLERLEIPKKSAKNDDSLSEVNTNPPLSNRATKNEFSWGLFISFLAGVGLILMFILI